MVKILDKVIVKESNGSNSNQTKIAIPQDNPLEEEKKDPSTSTNSKPVDEAKKQWNTMTASVKRQWIDRLIGEKQIRD